MFNNKLDSILGTFNKVKHQLEDFINQNDMKVTKLTMELQDAATNQAKAKRVLERVNELIA